MADEKAPHALEKLPEHHPLRRRDFVGYRKATDSFIWRCGCGCNGHVAIAADSYEPLMEARKRNVERAAADDEPHCFGLAFYVDGHEPLGIAAGKFRTGPRVRVRATS